MTSCARLARVGRLRSSPLCLCLLLLLASDLLPGQHLPYAIRPSSDSRLALHVYKTGLLSGKKHIFVFEKYHGRLEYDAGHPEQSTMELTIEARSLVIEDDWVKPEDLPKIRKEALDKKLAAEQHPTMVFRSRTIRSGAIEGDYGVEGDLTIRGITRPVTVAVRMTAGSEGGLVFAGEASIRMKDYGMKPPSAALGLIGTKNEMTLHFHLTASQAR